MIIPTLEHAIYAKMVDGLQDRLAEAGTAVIINTSGYDLERERSQARLLVARGVEAIILVGAEHQTQTVEALARAGVSQILTYTDTPGAASGAVGFNNYSSGASAAKYLLELGHRRFGMIAGLTRHNDRATLRRDGSVNALTEAGIRRDDVVVVEAPYHHTPRYKGRKVRPSPYRQFHAGLEVEYKAPPNKDRQRIGFGKVLERELTPQGLRFMNIQYRSTWLDKLLHAKGRHDGSRRKSDKLLMKIKVDPMDLGCISALIEGRWVTIPGPRELSGIDLDTWIEMGDRNAREIGEQARVDFEKFVAPALLDIDAAARRAERQLGFTDLDWTADMMNEAERLLRTFVVYDREPAGQEPGVSGSSRQLGRVMSRPVTEDASVSSPVTPPAAEALPTEETAPVSPGAPVRRPSRSRR